MTNAAEDVAADIELRLYAAFMKARESLARPEKPMPYDWHLLPLQMPMHWIVYHEMLSEFARELAGVVNHLIRSTHAIEVWDKVLDGLGPSELLAADTYFVGDLTAVALNLPYAIKNRFAFAVYHLSHQANDLCGKPESAIPIVPDDKVDFAAMSAVGKPWRDFTRLNQRIEVIGGKSFRDATDNYRNLYTHRSPRRTLIGLSQTVVQTVHPMTGNPCWGVGGKEALSLKAIAVSLKVECARCAAAFFAFQKLIEDQIKTIVAQGAGSG
jgi:hypothetical protein